MRTYEDGTIAVRVLESGGPGIGETLFELNADFTIRAARFSDAYWDWHRRLEGEGKLDHHAENCPGRAGLVVESWSRETGWTALAVPVR